jgi:hypothetical protein
MDSVDVFNVAEMEIMHQCLSTFPVPAQIESKKISKVVGDYFQEPNNSVELFAHITKLDEICQHTIKWLQTEDFLMDGGSNISFYRLTLSQKGLNAINSLPSNISEKRTIRSYISGGLSKVSSGTASGIMVELFKNGI